MAGRLDRLLDWLFPRRCAFCGHPVETGQTACSRCREELPRIAGPVCPLCGREKGSCRCGQRRRAYRRCVSPFYYEGPAKRGILRLKLYGKVYAAEGFAQAMAETVRREYEGIAFDALVPVPISDSTRRERGFGTLFPAVFGGTDLFHGDGLILLVGVCVTLAGIAVIGYAGSLRARNMTDEEKKAAVKDFALTKGLLVALLAGVMSACFNLGLESGTPILEKAKTSGASELFALNPVILLVTMGGFLTNAVYCIYQNIKNKSGKDYFSVTGKILLNNVLFCALAGVLWYSQFFGLGMGKSYFADSPVMLAFSWSILMSLNVIFSNVWGIVLNEWKGVSRKTIIVLVSGMCILIFSLLLPNLLG